MPHPHGTNNIGCEVITRLVGIFGCVEPCQTYFLRGNRQAQKLEFTLQSGKGQHFYFYHLHREFGLMHLRLQSWFPFQVHICINGREWLSRQMDRHQMDYSPKENCFTWISHVHGAQRLLDQQLQMDWPQQLDRILRQNHPLAAEICRPLGLKYYWTTQESEYATDLMFHSPKPLQRIYPALVRHAITSFSSADVMRFLGHRLVHLPVHANWLNQIEIYFSVVQRKVLTPNDFPSLDAIAQRLLEFQSYYERTAKPFEWRFTRVELKAMVAKLNSTCVLAA